MSAGVRWREKPGWERTAENACMKKKKEEP